MKRAPSVELWSVAGLVAAAILIRATRLGESLWYDEIAAYLSHAARGPAAIIGSFVEPSNHIAHTLLSWCSVTVLQDAIGFELALRLPALLFSAGAVAAMALLARVVLDRRGVLLAAAIMAVAPVAVLSGVEARGYSMMICFSALASWALLANLDRPRTWRWLLYAVFCALGTWTHFVTAFVPVGHAVWLAWRATRFREIALAVRGGLAILLAAALSIALYAPAVPDFWRHRGLYAAAGADQPSVLGAEGWHTLLQLGGSWYVWAALPGLALFVIGLLGGRTESNRGPRLGDAAAVTLLGLPIFLLVVVMSGSWMYARFALLSLPGAVLLMAAGLETLLRWRPAAGLAAGAMVLAAAVADLATRPAKQPLRDAANDVRSGRVDGEAILVVGLAHRVLDVYLGDLDPQYSLLHGVDLDEKIAATNPTWIILYYPQSVGVKAYAALAANGFTEHARFRGWVDWTNGDVIVYRD